MESRLHGMEPPKAPERAVPDDFHQRIATKIVATLERERDPDAALQQIGEVTALIAVLANPL